MIPVSPQQRSSLLVELTELHAEVLNVPRCLALVHRLDRPSRRFTVSQFSIIVSNNGVIFVRGKVLPLANTCLSYLAIQAISTSTLASLLGRSTHEGRVESTPRFGAFAYGTKEKTAGKKNHDDRERRRTARQAGWLASWQAGRQSG